MCQTFKDFEVICVDDCSTDDSIDIVNSFVNIDSRFKLLLHKENRGLGAARNTAIRFAEGGFFASVDSDDYVERDFLQIIYDTLQKSKCDVIIFGYNRVDVGGNILSSYTPRCGEYYKNENSIDIFNSVNPAFWNKVWRAELFMDNSIFFPDNLYYQDLATTPRLLYCAKMIVLISDVLYGYTQRDDSISASFSEKNIIDYFKVFAVLDDFVCERCIEGKVKKEFNRLVDRNILFHAKNLIRSSIGNKEKIVYLQLLVLLKDSFISDYKYIRHMNIHQLEEILTYRNVNYKVTVSGYCFARVKLYIKKIIVKIVRHLFR